MVGDPGSAWAPARGELIWVAFTPHAGHEQGGRRPALVISPRVYNARVGLCLACPVTHRLKGYPFEVPLPAGGAVQGVILADQVRTLDWRARDARSAGSAPQAVVAGVLARLLVLLDAPR